MTVDLIAALEIPADIDLSQFISYLRQQGVRLRVSEEGVNQVVWVGSEYDSARVQQAYSDYKAGNLSLQEQAAAPSAPDLQIARRIKVNLARFPLTMLLILVNVALYPVGMGPTDGDYDGELFHLMTLLDFELAGDRVYFQYLGATLAAGEVWRLLTPMFLHFGLIHIVFNLLWIWEIGRRIELLNGTLMLLMVTVLSSLAANLTQYVISGPGFFGGMSGVVFGYLGHCLVWDRLMPQRKCGLPPGIYIFMLIFLAVGFTGAIDLLGMGSLANGAHLGGLIGGLVTGATVGLWQRSKGASR